MIMGGNRLKHQRQNEQRPYQPFDLAKLDAVTVTQVPTHLYIAKHLDDGTVSERFYLCSLPAGALLLPLAIPGYSFIGTPTAETEKSTDGLADAQALVLWQTAVANAPFLADPIPGMLAARARQTLQLEEDVLVTAKAPLWAVSSGPGLLIETNDSLTPEDAPFLNAAPLGPGWLVRTLASYDVEFWQPALFLQEKGMVAVQEVATVWALMAASWLEVEIKRREQQAQESSALSQRGYQLALERVAEAAQGQQQRDVMPTGPIVDPLLAALRQIGERQGISIQVPPTYDVSQPLDRRFARIAEESKFRYRLTILNGKWWKEQGVPLLAQKKDGTPVALLPSRKGYHQAEGEKGLSRLIDESFAAMISEQAYTIYATFPQELNNREILSFAAQDIRRDAVWLLSAAAAVSLLGLLVPVITALFVNNVIPAARFPLLGELVLILVAVAIGSTLFQIIQGLTTARVNVMLDLRLQPAVWDRIMRLPTAFFRDYGTGDLTLRVLGIKTISSTLSGTVVGGVLTGILSLSSFLVMALYDIPLTLFALVYALVMILLLGILTHRQLKWSRAVYLLMGRVENFVLQVLSSIGKLRVAAAEERAFSRWANAYAEQRRNQTQAKVIYNVIQTLTIALPILGTTGLFLIAGTRADSINSGAFIAFNAAFGQFTTATIFFTNSILQSVNVIPLYDRLKPVLAAVPEIDPSREDPELLSGEIAVRNLSFRYHEGGPLVLQDVSFDVQPGKFVALVGPSGAGKSTILRMLLGFEQPVHGGVFYDDQDLARLNLLLVRRQIGTVLQSVGLIPGSIYDNISGAGAFSREQVMEAARMAGFADDIEAMPMGLETLVSEGGGNLSGGQQQRLMIARILVRKPQIIFFDEATSALDNRTQAAVTESLENFHTTRIVIAHRLSTIRGADLILVVDEGRIVQRGTYKQLIGQEGLFKTLAERQIV